MGFPRRAIRLPGARRSKYGNHRVYVDSDGNPCPKDAQGAKKIADSLKEYRRLLFLLEEEKRGQIHALGRQRFFPLHSVNSSGVKTVVGRYRCDFHYVRAGKWIVEDVKGFKTPEYILKAKMMAGEYGIVIGEI